MMVKRVLSALIAAVLLVSVLPFAAYAGNDTASSDVPLVVVSGFGTVPLYLHANTPQAEQVFAPTGKTIAKGVLRLLWPTLKAFANKDWNAWTAKADPVLYEMFEPNLCDTAGNSVYDVGVRKFPLSADHYPDFYLSDVRDEAGLVHAGIDAFGGENVYFFSYDWRLDPMIHADDLSDFIETVLQNTGKQQVALVACSMGGAITMAYLSKYGAGKLKTCIMNNTAFQGISMIGELFRQDVSIDKDTMVEYMFQFINIPPKLNAFLKNMVKRLHLTDLIIAAMQGLAHDGIDDVARDVLYPLFGQMPGIWAFVSDEDFEKAKQCALDPQTHAALIRRIDAYHYGVQQHVKDILDNALDDGCFVTVLANYGKYGIPVTSSQLFSNDYLIDTSLSSGGAVCADIGKTLPDGYTQKVDDGHDHISPDRRIDASTCMYPEYTWFTKNMGHLDFPFGSQGADFLIWLICADEQPTVWTNARYPQFMVFDRPTGILTAQTK